MSPGALRSTQCSWPHVSTWSKGLGRTPSQRGSVSGEQFQHLLTWKPWNVAESARGHCPRHPGVSNKGQQLSGEDSPTPSQDHSFCWCLAGQGSETLTPPPNVLHPLEPQGRTRSSLVELARPLGNTGSLVLSLHDVSFPFLVTT